MILPILHYWIIITADGSTSVGTISSGGNNFEFEDITLNNVNIIVKNAFILFFI